MILACPLCQTRFLVPAHAFVAGARQVRCGKCKHGWLAEPPRTIEVVAMPVEPPPEAPLPMAEGSNLPVVAPTGRSRALYYTLEAIPALLLGLIIIWLILDRQQIARDWPMAEPVYNAVGLYIYYPGDGLEFDDVRSELQFDSGRNMLVLTGKIKNMTEKNQKVPAIVAQALGPDGDIIQSWQIDAPVAKLAPKEEAPFTSSLNAPKGSVVNVNLNFVESKDDQ